MGLKDSKTHNLTDFAVSFSIILVILTLSFSVIKTIADNKNEHAKEEGQFVLNELLDSVNSSKATKLRRFKKFIFTGEKKEKAFFSITQPEDQIEELLKSTQLTLSNLFGMNRNDIGLSILFSTRPKSIRHNDWNWLKIINVKGSLNKKELFENSNSTFRTILDNNLNLVFFPDKRVGVKENKYIPCELDEKNNNIGSIYCKDISIRFDDNIALRAILSISTYGLQLCRKNDKNAIRKIEKIILPTFEQRLEVELALHYIKKSKENKCLSCK